uniref:Putative IstB domain protein ATP-binding protein n=1 Tax=viral metagenome TaxID=1070528 RepID=A0A6H1ZZX6_9ZZZZ
MTEIPKMKVRCAKCHDEFEVATLSPVGIARPLSEHCPACRTKLREEYDLNEKLAVTAHLASLRREHAKNSNIPPRYAEASFEDLEKGNGNIDRLIEVCQDYAENFPLSANENYKSLGLFSHGYGNGKTHLACAIGRRVLERWNPFSTRTPVYYITEQDILGKIRATYSKTNDGNEYDIVEYLGSVPLLIVDDIGKEEIADPRFVQRVWFDLINKRYNNLMPIVITANKDNKELAKHLGSDRNNEAAFDRLYEMLGGIFWENTGESYRRKD